MPDDSLEYELRSDDSEVGRAAGERGLERGRLEQPRRDDDRLTGNPHRVTGHRSDVDGDPQLEPGGPAISPVVPVKRRG